MEIGECDQDFNELINMVGTYIVSDGESLVVCYRCEESNIEQITLEGNCMYVIYARGDLPHLLSHCEIDCVDYIIYERNSDGKYRKLPFKRFYQLINR